MPIGLGGLAAIGGIANVANSLINNAIQRDENRIDRDFNAQQAELQRNFQSKEAELAYERQVDFYDTRQSPAAMVEQYKSAGINPAVAFGQGSAGGVSTTPVSSLPSGSSASARSNSLPGFIGIADQMVTLQKSVEEMKLLRAQADEAASRTALNRIDEIFRSGINEATIAQAWASAGQSDAARDKLIQDVINSKQLTAAQVKELTEKALYYQASADERSTASAYNVESVWSKRAETKERIANVGFIIQNVRNASVDEQLKSQYILQSIAQTALYDQTKLEVSKRIELLGAEIGLTSEQSREVSQKIKNLEQQYGHREIMNAFEQIIANVESGEANAYRTDNLAGVIIKTLQGFIPFLDFGI